MNLIADEARWRREARGVLSYMTLRAFPDHARPDGLRAFLLQVSGDILEWEVAPLKVAGLAQRIWRRSIKPSNLSNRMTRAGIPSPMTWITAYRAAAVGVFMYYGVKASIITNLLGFESQGQVYHVMKSAAEAAGAPPSCLRDASQPDVGFKLYVQPLIPGRKSSAWAAKIEPIR